MLPSPQPATLGTIEHMTTHQPIYHCGACDTWFHTLSHFKHHRCDRKK